MDKETLCKILNAASAELADLQSAADDVRSMEDGDERNLARHVDVLYHACPEAMRQLREPILGAMEKEIAARKAGVYQMQTLIDCAERSCRNSRAQ